VLDVLTGKAFEKEDVFSATTGEAGAEPPFKASPWKNRFDAELSLLKIASKQKKASSTFKAIPLPIFRFLF